MNVPVVAQQGIHLQVSSQPNSLVLTWSGGSASFQVQVSTNLSGTTWQNLGAPTTSGSFNLTPVGSTAFFRVVPAGN
jgi:hypothetical protein